MSTTTTTTTTITATTDLLKYHCSNTRSIFDDFWRNIEMGIAKSERDIYIYKYR
jgi:hypothetical protein